MAHFSPGYRFRDYFGSSSAEGRVSPTVHAKAAVFGVRRLLQRVLAGWLPSGDRYPPWRSYSVLRVSLCRGSGG